MKNKELCKKIDMKRIVLDAIKYFIYIFLITVAFCTCMQNGWLPVCFTGDMNVEYSEFWYLLRNISFLVPVIMLMKGFCGYYTYYIKIESVSHPIGTAHIR